MGSGPRASMHFIVLAVVFAAKGQIPHAASLHMRFQVTSSAFAAGQVIPPQYACDGADQSQAVQWTEASGTVTFALVVDDPDAPVGDWWH